MELPSVVPLKTINRLKSFKTQRKSDTLVNAQRNEDKSKLMQWGLNEFDEGKFYTFYKAERQETSK